MTNKKQRFSYPVKFLFICLAGGLILLLGQAWMVSYTPIEPGPKCKGVSLKEWVIRYQQSDGKDENAASAIKAIGTNGIPSLVRWIERDLTPQQLQKESDSCRFWRTFGINQARSLPMAFSAVNAFAALGESGSNAIPALVKLLHQKPMNHSPVNAGYALAHIGPAGLPCLFRALTNEDVVIRERASNALRVTGSNAIPFLLGCLHSHNTNDVIPAIHVLAGFSGLQAGLIIPLSQCLSNTHNAVVEEATIQIMRLGKSGKTAVPALAHNLSSTNPVLRKLSAEALQSIGKDAQPAIPYLLKNTNDPDYYSRFHAIAALRAIAPQTLTTNNPP